MNETKEEALQDHLAEPLQNSSLHTSMAEAEDWLV